MVAEQSNSPREILGYRLVEPIGQGGMATVWRAENPLLGRSVAVKILDPVLAREADVVERFLNEARIEARLRHPNIVSVENVGLDPPAILMEYVEGRDLSSLIGKEVGPIPLPRAVPVMRQILDAVGHAHAHGIIHRDIKPSNVLIANDGAGAWSVKVMDFGIAKVLGTSRMTRTGAAMGTADYMSPEQIRGAHDADARSDIYSLAVTFYEMLAGRTPFEQDPITGSDFELRLAHVQQDPPDPRTFYPQIPAAVVEVVLTGLRKRPEERFQSVDAFRRALAAAAASAGVTWGAPLPSAAQAVAVAPAPVVRPVERAPRRPVEPSTPGRQAHAVGSAPLRPKTFLAESILVTLFCCLPLGVVGIVHAGRVNSQYDSGQYDEALKSSQMAHKWNSAAVLVGLVVTVLFVMARAGA